MTCPPPHLHDVFTRASRHARMTPIAIGWPRHARQASPMTSNTFIYPALDRCYRLGRYLVQEILTEFAVWAGQDRVLCALHPEHANIQAELSRKLYMNERTLHRSLRYLAKLQYIKMNESRTDARLNSIFLTRMGKSTVEAVTETYGIVDKQMMVGMSPGDVEDFRKLLKVAIMREDVLRARKLDLRDVLDRGFF